ncbi:MAG: hypothetical protein V1745_01320 [Patescibacteria group bacterium]
MEKDLQVLLSQTSLDGVTWEEIPWPHESFALVFDVPVVDASGHSYDCLVVSTEPRTFNGRAVRMAYLRLLDTRLASFRPVMRNEHQKMLKLMEKGRYNKVLNIGREWEGRTADIFFPQYLIPLEEVADVAITAPANEAVNKVYGATLREGERPEWDLMIRLVAGVCLYVASLPPGSSHRSDWTPLNKTQRLDPRAITNDAEICRITSVHSLTAEERDAVTELSQSGRPTYELCAHFRRGHWRRPPGKGDNPSAPRNVWVRPTLVRRDRLAPDALPRGVETNLW